MQQATVDRLKDQIEKHTIISRFPGYVTFDYGRDGRVEGMLSVNAVTSVVWPHAWHGVFLGEAHD